MDVDVIIVGAGVVGLAVAAELAPWAELLLLEREEGYGRGVSSRNSEVVHAGIYYEPGSLKARLCLEGRRRIEEWAAQGHFGYRKTGKFIVATRREELSRLDDLLEQGRLNGVTSLRRAGVEELAAAEPAVRALAALWSPETAILDSHGLMRHLWERARAAGAQLACRSRVAALRPVAGGWELEVEEGEGALAPCREEEAPPVLPRALPRRGPRLTISARAVVNAAGLEADQVAALAGIDVEGEGLRQYWSRGEYFTPRGGACPPLRHLIYPLPPADGEGHLGIHVTLDLGGALRFGPSATWPCPPHSRREDFAQDEALAADFAAGVSRFLPGLAAADLRPAGVGLRPRRKPAGDFYIREEGRRGLAGLVNLIGVESPGLTSAPAIARLVGEHLAGVQRV